MKLYTVFSFFLFCALFACNNTNKPQPNANQINSDTIIVDTIIRERIQNYEEPTAFTFVNDTAYKLFYYYKRASLWNNVKLKKEHIIIKRSREIDTTLIPIIGSYELDLDLYTTSSDVLYSVINSDMDGEPYFAGDFFSYGEPCLGNFKMGQKDGEWTGYMCGGMNQVRPLHIFYTEGRLDSLIILPCPPPHKGPISGVLTTYKYYFNANLVHGNCYEIKWDLDAKNPKEDTVIHVFQNGVMNVKKMKNIDIEEFEDTGYEDAGAAIYTYKKQKRINGKKQGEWIASGLYQKTDKSVEVDTYIEVPKNVVVCNYKDDLLHGQYTISNFHNNILPPQKNEKKTIFYQTEFKNGTGYFVSRDLMTEGPMINSKKNGYWKYFSEWNQEKKLYEKGLYIDDRKHGVWEVYNEKSEIYKFYFYQYGHLLYDGEAYPSLYVNESDAEINH